MNLNDRLIEASKNGDIVKIKSLLKEGADINANDNHWGKTALMTAVKYSGTTSSLDTVRLLLNNGADINSNDRFGLTSLMTASTYSSTTSSLDTVELLINKGADVNAKNDSGMSSLIFSSWVSNTSSSLATIRLLLKEGANVNDKNNFGWTSLTYASRYSNSTSSLDTIRLLLDNGANINAKDNDGWTILMRASWVSDNDSSDDTIRLLLSYGADPFVKSNKGKYPLDVCPTESCRKIISSSMWNIMNNSIAKSAEFYSEETPISKDVWELILLRNKQRQLCKDLSKEENKYVLQGFATMLNIPISVLMTKRQLCNLVSKQLSQGRKLKTNKENLVDIIKLAKKLGINTDQSIDKILDDISSV